MYLYIKLDFMKEVYHSMKPNRKLKVTRIPKMDAKISTNLEIDNINKDITEEAEIVKASEAEDIEVTPVTLEYTEQDESALARNVTDEASSVSDDTTVFTPVSEDSTIVFDAVSSDNAVSFDTAEENSDAGSVESLLSEYSEEETEKVIDVSAYAPPYTSFDDQLDMLTANDVDPEGKSRRGGFPLFSVIRYLMIVICLCIFTYCAFLIARTFIGYAQGEVIYGGLADEFFSMLDGSSDDGSARMDQVNADFSAPTMGGMTDEWLESGGDDKFTYQPVITSKDNPFDQDPEIMVENLKKLKEVSPDLYGWIYIAGTKINYPIVQGGDNTYYLTHSVDGVDLPQGSIFADFRCNDEIMRNFNTVLYGHNMKNGSMFHDVEKFYKDENLFRNSQVIICTFDGIFYYEPFAVFHTSYDTGYNETGFPTYEAFLEFANRMQDMSVYKKNMKFVISDRVLTLSTCTNGIKTDRYGLISILTEAKKVNVE